MVQELSPRRREILEAATTVLADHGARGLTHRAVDRAAAIPEGSTSAYFRSRDALQGALAEYVAARLVDDVRALAGDLATQAGDHTHAVTATSALLTRWLRQRTLLTARLELTVAATRDAQLAEGFLAWRLELQEVVHSVFETPDRGATLVAALDGVLLAALLLPLGQGQRFTRNGVDQLLTTLDKDH